MTASPKSDGAGVSRRVLVAAPNRNETDDPAQLTPIEFRPKVPSAGRRRTDVLVNYLVRMSLGKMMGVDFNKEKNWVGSSVALHER